MLRNEKKKEELQTLEASFYMDVATYVREKKGLLDVKRENEDIFAGSDRSKLDYELRSIQRILKELYEKREKKIIDIALNKSRTGSDIINTSSMLREEKGFYEAVLLSLDQFRQGILFNMYKGDLPEVIKGGKSRINLKVEDKPIAPVVVKPIVKEIPKVVEESENESNEEPENLKIPTEPKKSISESPKEKIKVKFLHAMPSFVWKDMKVYGPFDEGQEMEIFKEVADLLERKGRVEII
jgi:DNA replication initiation complex subunit (GINS family)